MNYMKQVAEMLGVELGEKFDIEVGNGFTLDDYYITEDGLCNGENTVYNTQLFNLLTGSNKIKKKPWRPKSGDMYFYVTPDRDIGGNIFGINYSDGLALLYMGNCFRTHEEAVAHKDEIMAKFKEALGE